MPTETEAKKDKDLIESLKKRKPAVEERLNEIEIVKDVLARMVLKRGRKDANSTELTTKQWTLAELIAGKAELEYLPKGGTESDVEYGKRIRMTPDFYETPDILNDTQGALFQSPPQLEGDDAPKYADIEAKATSDGHTLNWVNARASELLQSCGFYGILVDRAKASDEDQAAIDAGRMSQAEADKKGS